MENEVLIYVSGMQNRRCEEKIVREITMMPGIELVQANAKKGLVSVTGGDLDQLQIVDVIESMGYKALN